MPILEINKSRYPADWKSIRAEILERGKNCCEFCGVPNYTTHPKTGAHVILTIAHLNHTPENNGVSGDRPNLKALCQRCHNRYDAKHRAQTRSKTRITKVQEAGQISLDLTAPQRHERKQGNGIASRN